MKHNLKITFILLAMFLVTQFIGLYVVNHYSDTKIIDGQIQEVDAPDLPFGLETPELKETKDYNEVFISIIFAFVIAIVILFLLTKFNVAFVLKLWFFMVVLLALGISFTAILPKFESAMLLILLIAIPLAYIKIYRQEFIVHNLTELLIYPGIAAVFVPILNIYTIIVLLILISIYDMWAVWHSGIMQKMAKYQMDKLQVFSGFFVPYASKKVREQIKKMKKTKLKNKKIKVNVAILGGGDVIFPIITAGVLLKTGLINLPLGLPSFMGGIYSALFAIAGATLGLSYLFFWAEKKKFYPAMPFITGGIFLGIILSWIIQMFY